MKPSTYLKYIANTKTENIFQANTKMSFPQLEPIKYVQLVDW